MNSKELMIGDWVLYGDKSVKVLQLSENSEYDWVKPILLTPEILEKNGVRKRRDEYAVFGWEGMKQWYVTLEDFKPQYDFWFITSSDRDLNICGQIRYVHQL